MAQRRKLKFSLEGPREVRSGLPALFAIVVTDQDDNKVPVPDNSFRVVFCGNGEQPVHPKIRDNALGGLEFEVLPYKAGSYQIEVYRGDSMIFKETLDAVSKKATATVGLSIKTKLKMKGVGLMGGKTGEETSFQINAYDSGDGKPVILSDGDVTVTIKGLTGDAEGDMLPVKLSGNGAEWMAAYVPIKPGAYEVDVRLRDKSVLRRPHRVNFSSEVDALQSLIALPITTCNAGTPVNFKIIAKDKTGYRLGQGGHTFSIKSMFRSISLAI